MFAKNVIGASLRRVCLCVILMGLMGCSSVNGTALIRKTKTGVKFESSRPAKMTMKEGDNEYTYDSQAPSLLSRIMSAVTLGVVGAGRN